MSLRESWFERGVEAFRRFAPDAPPDIYFCPLCAKGYGRDALEDRTLTIEHAPPEALGGRPVCLTCKPCNSGAGHTVDAHMARRDTTVDFLSGAMEKPAPARFEFGGTSLNVDYYSGPAGVLVLGDPRRNSPLATEQATEAFKDAYEAQALSFKVTPSRLGYDHRLQLAGWLRSAYLIGFAVLGYAFIFQQRLRPVRRQLEKPQDAVIDCFSVTLPKAERDARNFLFVHDPEDLSGIAVQMGRQLVFLPWLEDGLYDALKRGREQGPRFDATLRGDQLPWPAEPMHLVDLGRLPGVRIMRPSSSASTEGTTS